MPVHLGEIRLYAGSFAPEGWAFCEGQLLPVSEAETLFHLLGTTFGGDGEETFALPDLRGRVPLHIGRGTESAVYALGEAGGDEGVVLTRAHLPPHTHAVFASAQPAGTVAPAGATWAASRALSPYAATATATMATSAVAATGQGAPHDNMQPYAVVAFIIALHGIYPGPAPAAMFAGEVRPLPYATVPPQCLPCDGQTLTLQHEYSTLFAAIGTLYGGDGFKTMMLPDLRGRVPLHTNADFPMAWRGGVEAHALSPAQMPRHTHTAMGSRASASTSLPAGKVWAVAGPDNNAYAGDKPNQPMAAVALDATGGGEPHRNMQPWLALNHCIGVATEPPTAPFVSEIRMLAGKAVPAGWMSCNGQVLKMKDNAALYALLGTTFGGDGKDTFALPDLRGRVPLQHGQGAGLTPRLRGEHGGAPAILLAEAQMPVHTHAARCAGTARSDTPAGNVWSATAGRNFDEGPPLYGDTADAPMTGDCIGSTGGGQPHTNLQPSLALNFIIAVQGVFPPRG